MQVAVWDTYVTKKDGTIMHFDIIVPAVIKDPVIIYGYGQKYLLSKGQENRLLNSKECKFCHEEITKPQIEDEIISNGYYIIEMENCNS